MKLSHNNLNNDQPKSLSNRNDKKSVNIKWNSKLIFQLGLIISLCLVYLIMETKFKIIEKDQAFISKEYLAEIPMVTYTIDEPIQKIKKKVIIEKYGLKVITNVINIVPNETKDKYLKNILVSTKETPLIIIPKKETKEEIDVIKNILGVEFVPVFPGCEKLSSNKEKRNCMSLKIKKFIVKKFNTDKIEESSKIKEQIIIVQFTIDSNGLVTNVTARAPNKLLEKEAKRVVSNLPMMIPGRQGNKNVAVQYMIPITFKTEF
jgi:protein TonB